MGDEGKCHETEYVSDFSDKLQSDSITADVRPIVSSDVLDVDVTGVSGGEIKLAAVVETKVWADENREIKYLGSADAYVEESETAYCRLVARGKSSAEYAAANRKRKTSFDYVRRTQKSWFPNAARVRIPFARRE